MPDLSLTETILGVLAALGVGGTAVGAARGRRPQPGTPEDHEHRLVELERVARDAGQFGGRLTTLEHRMNTHETQTAAELAKLNESGERAWNALEKIAEKIDDMHKAVVRLDVVTEVERDQRRASSPLLRPTPPPGRKDPTR